MCQTCAEIACALGVIRCANTFQTPISDNGKRSAIRLGIIKNRDAAFRMGSSVLLYGCQKLPAASTCLRGTQGEQKVDRKGDIVYNFLYKR